MDRGLPSRWRDRLDPEQRYGLRVTLVLLAAILVAAPFATLLFQVVARGPLVRVDADLARALNGAASDAPALVDTMSVLTLLGQPAWLAVLVGAAVVFTWRRGRPRLAAFVAVTAIGGGLLNSAMKVVVDRPRPELDATFATASGLSFPSGHAMAATVVYGALLLAFLPAVARRWRAAAVVATGTVVLVVGASRLVLGVHFLTDVVGGHVLGLAWLAGATAAFEIWREERGRPPARPLAEGVEPEAGRALREGAGAEGR